MNKPLATRIAGAMLVLGFVGVLYALGQSVDRSMQPYEMQQVLPPPSLWQGWLGLISTALFVGGALMIVLDKIRDGISAFKSKRKK